MLVFGEIREHFSQLKLQCDLLWVYFYTIGIPPVDSSLKGIF